MKGYINIQSKEMKIKFNNQTQLNFGRKLPEDYKEKIYAVYTQDSANQIIQVLEKRLEGWGTRRIKFVLGIASSTVTGLEKAGLATLGGHMFVKGMPKPFPEYTKDYGRRLDAKTRGVKSRKAPTRIPDIARIPDVRLAYGSSTHYVNLPYEHKEEIMLPETKIGKTSDKSEVEYWKERAGKSEVQVKIIFWVILSLTIGLVIGKYL